MNTVKINPLSEAKKNTKAINKVKKAEAKKVNDQIKDLKRSIKTDWLNDTQSVSALVKYIRKNKENVLPLVKAINEKFNISLTVGDVNASVLKFGHLHELNKVDLDGNVIDKKNYFNISFLLRCTERKAKYINDIEGFKKYSQELTNKNLAKKYSNFVHKKALIHGDQVHEFINTLIDEKENIGMEAIKEALKTEFVDPKLNA
ncbi:MAG: hypothetical protein ACTHY0_02200 [Mammaliicoccus vitulinus]